MPPRPDRRRVLSVLPILAAALSAPVLLSGCIGTRIDPSLFTASGDEAVNQLRRDNGLGALAIDRGLVDAAQEQADAMAAKERMNHDAGGPFGERVRRHYGGLWFAENISAGQDSIGEAVNAWIRSAPHRRNMLDRNMRAYGIASARSASGRPYWAMVLGG